MVKYNYNFLFPVLLKILFVISILALSACGKVTEIDQRVMQNEQTVQDAIATISPDSQSSRALQIDNRPWFGSTAVSMKSGQSLPRQFTGANAITLTFAGEESFESTARKIQSVTGIPVTISKNIYSESLGDLAEKSFVTSGGPEVAGGSIVWSGSWLLYTSAAAA